LSRKFNQVARARIRRSRSHGGLPSRRLRARRASYVNWMGRSNLQAHQEAELRTALQQEVSAYIKDHSNAGDDVRGIRNHLIRFAHENPNLMPCDVPTPIGWWIRNWLHYAIIPVLLALPSAFAIEKLIVQPLWLLIVVASFGLLVIVIFIWFSIVATWAFALLVALGLMLILQPLLVW
jgi:hypothetical protein